VEKTVGGAPSTLRLILPEAGLNAPDVDEHIAGINQAMKEYLDEGVFKTLSDSLFILSACSPTAKCATASSAWWTWTSTTSRPAPAP
jgi:hypothetical protein